MVAKYPESRTDEFVYLWIERKRREEKGRKRRRCSHTPI